MAELIAIEITELEAAIFRLMRENGTINLLNGSVSIFFKDGKLKSVKVESYTQLDNFHTNSILE